MKKFAFALFTMAAALAITPSALAGTLCPNQALQGGFGGQTYTPTAGSLDGTCGANSAIIMSIPSDTDYAKLTWDSTHGLPADLTIGNLPGVVASVSLSPSNGDQPFYELAFTDPGDTFLNTTTGDQILLIEFQTSALSGPGNDTMALDPNSTLFNLYDNTSGIYLEAPGGIPGAAGQQNANSLDGWIAQDPALSNDAVQEIRLGMGLAGGPSDPESLTVDSAVVTPEPTSLLLLGTGLDGLAGMLRRKLRG